MSKDTDSRGKEKKKKKKKLFYFVIIMIYEIGDGRNQIKL